MELVRSNWYSSPDAVSWYSERQGKPVRRIRIEVDSRKSEIEFLEYRFGDTLNLLPVGPYYSISLSSDIVKELLELEHCLKGNGVTSAYLPTVSTTEINNVLTKQLCSLYSARGDSYYIDLSLNAEELLSRVSKRKRIDAKNWESAGSFFFADSKDKKQFISLYKSFAKAKGFRDSAVVKTCDLERLLDMPSIFVTGVRVRGNIERMHLIGLSDDRSNADYLYVASTKSGCELGTQLMWFDILSLKRMGGLIYHLGGGVSKGDGVEIFKQRMGGIKLLNGGLRLVVDKERFEFYTRNTPDNNFFPPYLQSEIYSRQWQSARELSTNITI